MFLIQKLRTAILAASVAIGGVWACTQEAEPNDGESGGSTCSEAREMYASCIEDGDCYTNNCDNGS